MNIDQLMESLSGNAPDPENVLASMHRKHRAARNRLYTASGGLAVVIVAIVASVLLQGVGAGRGTTAGSAGQDSGVAFGPAAPAASSPAAANGMVPSAGWQPQQGDARSAASAASCDAPRLQAILTAAVRQGASVIVGYGTPASGATAAAGTGASASTWDSVTLRSIETLAGPVVASGSIAWIAGPGAVSASASSGTASSGTGSASAGQTLAPGSRLFGIVSPTGRSGAPGPVLQAALVDHGQVLLSPAGCWDVTAPAASTAQGGFPGPGPTGPASPGVPGLTEIPLATAEKLAAQSG